jgi:4-hydroxybenzoate polyprenyltransferase
MKYRIVPETYTSRGLAGWFHKNKMGARGVQYLFTLMSMGLFFFLSLKQQIGVGVLLATSILYLFFIRKVPFIKPFFVALVWSVYCLWLPNAACMQGCPATTNYWEAFFLVAALTVIFEIKDIQADALYGIKTIPLSFGVKITKLLAVMLLVSSLWITMLYHINWDVPSVILIAEFVFVLIAAFILIKTDENSSEQWFYGCVDGLLIFQTLFLYLATLM